MPFHTFVFRDKKLIYNVAGSMYTDSDIQEFMAQMARVEGFNQYRQIHDFRFVVELTVAQETMDFIVDYLENANELIVSAYVIGDTIDPEQGEAFLGTLSGAVRRIYVCSSVEDGLNWLGMTDVGVREIVELDNQLEFV